MKTILVDAMNTFVIPGQGIYQPLFHMLEKYPNQKIILTNADDEQMITFGLVDLPYQVFTRKHHPDKTNPEYFLSMLTAFKLSTEDVIYFEYNKAAVESAQSVGITTYWYDPEKKDVEMLKMFLDKHLH